MVLFHIYIYIYMYFTVVYPEDGFGIKAEKYSYCKQKELVYQYIFVN